MSKYKYLLLDADGTLYDFHATEKIALKRLFDHYRIADTDENRTLYHTGNSKCWEMYEAGSITMEELKGLRFSLFFSAMGLDISASEAGALFIDYLAAEGIMIDGALEVLKSLYGRYTLVMITNGIAAVQKGRLATSDTLKYYRNIIISEEIGVQKPDAGFFEKTLGIINAEPGECLIIGDSLTSDIQGGINSGIDTLYLHLGKEAGKEKVWTYDAASYRELLTILA